MEAASDRPALYAGAVHWPEDATISVIYRSQPGSLPSITRLKTSRSNNFVSMKKTSIYGRRRKCLTTLLGIATCLQVPFANAEEVVTSSFTQSQPLEQRASISYDAYILGPGDGLEIELVDLPELSGLFAIGPDGTLYLPRLRALT